MSDERPNVYELLAEHIERFNQHSIKVERFMAAQEERCRSRLEMTITHNKALFGNGKPGLVEEVKEIKTKDAVASDGFARWIAICGAAGAIISIIIPFLKRG